MTRIIAALLMVGICSADTFTAISHARAKDRSIPAFTDYGGSATLDGRQLWLEVHYQDGSVGGGELLILFDRGSNVYWWQFEESSIVVPREQASYRQFDAISSGEIKVYAGRKKIIAFEGSLAIRESSEHADSLDDAEHKAFRSAQQWASPPLEARKSQFIGVGILRVIGSSIIVKPNEVFVSANLRLTSIARREGEWVLIYSGHWTARVILDDEFEIKTWERVPDGTTALGYMPPLPH